ncbi:MAG: histidine phosphatase family protein [Rhodocyclaceae bacterium]|nr:histidine phosphatase family protein [Rhodocyclaceae bacterium]MBX3668213.1 histidine phosphatase family protein [Rhodocyclaceae bacterium]
MDLILWRHADAVDGVPDIERALSARGEKQARAMAAWLRPRLAAGTRVLASPARRTQQTAAALHLPYTTDNRLATGARAGALLAASGWPDANSDVLIVGHQPTLGQCAALLLGGTEAEWSVKKGSIWWFSSRTRYGGRETVLRATLGPDLIDT